MKIRRKPLGIWFKITGVHFDKGSSVVTQKPWFTFDGPVLPLCHIGMHLTEKATSVLARKENNMWRPGQSWSQIL